MKKALSTIVYYTPIKYGKSEQIYYALERLIITDRSGAHDFCNVCSKVYESIYDLQHAVYHIALNNGYKINSYTDFNAIWYDILLMTVNGDVRKYPISVHLKSVFER